MKLKPLVASMMLAGAVSSSMSYAGDAVFYVTEEGEAASNISVVVNGEKKLVRKNGFVVFDLKAGNHVVELTEFGEWVGDVEFEMTSDTQEAEVNIEIIAGEAMAEASVFEPSSEQAQAVGQFAGVLSSEETAGAVSGARISVNGTEISTTTDDNGAFLLEIPRGQYDLTIAHPNYGNRDLKGLYVMSGAATRVDLELSMSGDGVIEEVVAIGSYVPASATASERDASGVLDAIGAEQLSRFGDSDAASAVKRVAGVTVADGKYVVVRGLNPRHSSIMFNGASLPSPDPTRRVVPLDIFPSAMIDGIEVQKTFTADVFADSTGGTIKLNTKNFPDEFGGKFSASLGYVDGTTGESRELQQSDSLDFIGFGADGDRELPDAVRDNKDELASSLMAPDERNRLSKEMVNSFGLEEQSIAPDIGIELGIGGPMVENDDYRIGYQVAFKFKNEWSSELDGHRNTYSASQGGGVTEDDDYDYIRTSNDIDLGIGVTFGFEWGDNQINSNTLWLRQTTAITEQIEGDRVGDQDRAVLSTEVNWFERQFLIQQFEGSHYFIDFLDTQMSWQVSFSQAELDSPDERSYSFESSDNLQTYDLFLSTLGRNYTELTDNNTDASIGLDSQFYLGDSLEFRARYGLGGFTRERDNEVIRVGYGTDPFSGTGSNLPPQYNGVTDIDQIINDTTIANGEFYINTAVTAESDQYDADWDLFFTYFMADLNWFDVVRVEVGARLEDSQMTVNTFDFGTIGVPVVAEVNDDDLFPAVNFIVPLGLEELQLRLGYTETKNRPDFRELAESQYIDPVTGDTFRGNSDLVSADVANYDLRLEYYFLDAESVTLAYFVKDFDNPIEKTLTTGGEVFTYDNGIEGNVDGIEIDFRKEFDFDSMNMFVSGNFAKLDSEVEIVVDTVLKKQAMQGQPEDVWNLQFGMDFYNPGLDFTVVFYHRGEAIYSVAQRDLPNIILEARSDLAMNFGWQMTEDQKLKLKLSNLLDEEYELTQGGENYRTFRRGSEVELGYSYEF